MYSSRITREFLNFYVHFDITNKSISFVLRPSTDLVRVLLGCQKWGRKKKAQNQHSVKTFISSELLQLCFGPQSRCTVHQLHLLQVPEESSPAEGESRHDSMCFTPVSSHCHPGAAPVSFNLPEVDTDGSLSQRETLLLGDPYKMSHLYELQKYQGTMSSKPFAKDMG